MGRNRALTEGRAVAGSPARAMCHAAPKGPTGDAGGALTGQVVLQILQRRTESMSQWQTS